MKKFITITLLMSVIVLSCEDNNNETITEQPEACFTTSTVNAKVGETIEFYNCTKNATLFRWNFGDGETSSLREPKHTFLKRGVYEVKLIAGKDKNQDGILDELDEPDIYTTEIIINPNHLSAKLTIWSTEGWSVDNQNYSLAVNAVVHFYKEYPDDFVLGEPDYTLYSDENGQIKIYDKEIDAVGFIVEQNDESNIVNGFLIAGIFANQQEIDNWTYIEDASIGSYKYLDLNGDGVINEMDKAPFESIFISLEETNEKVVYIGK